VKQSLWKHSGKYELWARKDSTFKVKDDQELEVFEVPMTVTPLSSLTDEQKQKQPVDVVGVVRRVSEVTTIKNSLMKELEIADDSEVACLLTLWGSWTTIEVSRGDIISVSKANISTFNTLSLYTSPLSAVTVNPNTNDTALRLSEWIVNTPVDVDSYPLVGKEKRRKTEKLAEISKSGTATVTIKKIFFDHKMTFISKKTGNIEFVLKMAVEDESRRLIVSGLCFLFLDLFLFLFLFLFLLLLSKLFLLPLQCSTPMQARFLARLPKKSRRGKTTATLLSWRL